MYVSGTDFSSQLVLVKPDFEIRTSLALNWIQAANGNWTATDRGSGADTYETRVTLAGHAAAIEAILDKIETNRIADSNELTMTGFESTEYIFGEDVNHASITANVLSVGPVAQTSWKMYKCDLELRNVSPSFTGSASLPDIDYIETNTLKGPERTLNLTDTYDGSFSYLDAASDAGTLGMTIYLTLADMKSMRRYLTATIRGGTITIAELAGIENPYGSTRTTTFPMNAKVLEWSDAGWFGLTHRKLKLKLAEVV